MSVEHEDENCVAMTTEQQDKAKAEEETASSAAIAVQCCSLPPPRPIEVCAYFLKGTCCHSPGESRCLFPHKAKDGLRLGDARQAPEEQSSLATEHAVPPLSLSGDVGVGSAASTDTELPMQASDGAVVNDSPATHVAAQEDREIGVLQEQPTTVDVGLDGAGVSVNGCLGAAGSFANGTNSAVDHETDRLSGLSKGVLEQRKGG
ncbi:hypothetical protein LTR85_004882 [Meristemomyces frigidus]|nr:hypothetical protein LTR85_004882 [Meristemomyces frigidus]